jgi:protein TonB
MKVVRGLRSDLDKKAIEAVSRWRFTPAVKDGNPVPASVTVEVVFRLY